MTGTTPTMPRATRRRGRTITDGLGKPWVFRQKDIWNFWSQPHYERVGGAELASATAWVPQGRNRSGSPRSAARRSTRAPTSRACFPIRNRRKRVLPHFSNGKRDDLIQRRYLEAVLGAFDPAFGAAALNSDLGRLWRPHDRAGRHPSVDLGCAALSGFPAATDVWSDAANWETGHWLTGRLGRRRSMRWSRRFSPIAASPGSTPVGSARGRTATSSTGR